MKTELFESLITHLGKTYHDLVKSQLIEKNSLRPSQYEDTETFEIESILGLELVFSPTTYRFEELYVRLRNDTGIDLPTYTDQLPAPLNSIRERKHAHQLLGSPISTSGLTESKSDLYQLDQGLNPAVQLNLQYGVDSILKVIVFSLYGA
ncbi:DUF6392 family protein [Pseudomonas sp. MWU12-2345]|uniref:DUF6392 family protein n=1 Tax=Pseudomonas sp. MWU12-2345 TaxID=2928689 RepID=UPI00200C48BC|nr:DUF6392 family protein [Pseudomonas sp. MWU12-2345]